MAQLMERLLQQQRVDQLHINTIDFGIRRFKSWYAHTVAHTVHEYLKQTIPCHSIHFHNKDVPTALTQQILGILVLLAADPMGHDLCFLPAVSCCSFIL